MTDSVLDKYFGKRPNNATATDPEPEADATDDLGCFGWLRGARERALMLELRKKDGVIEAVPYAWLERARFDPGEGITLTVMGRQVRIKGRNLNGEARPQIRLFNGLCRHRVPWVQEADAAQTLSTEESAVVIESIEW